MEPNRRDKGNCIVVLGFPKTVQLGDNINGFWLFKYLQMIAWSQRSICFEAVMFFFIFKSAVEALKSQGQIQPLLPRLMQKYWVWVSREHEEVISAKLLPPRSPFKRPSEASRICTLPPWPFEREVRAGARGFNCLIRYFTAFLAWWKVKPAVFYLFFSNHETLGKPWKCYHGILWKSLPSHMMHEKKTKTEQTKWNFFNKNRGS